MDALNLLIKPASGLCNMECCYCFYKEELSHSHRIRPEIMKEEVMELLIKRACEETERWLHVTFQGGEPTLAGLDFFQRFTELVSQQKKPTLQVSYSLQTNGLLLDQNWAEFLYKNQFLVGLSYDGMPYIHDRNRVDHAGRGTAERVEEAWSLLQKNRVETNLLCVVTRQIAKKPGDVYRYMKKKGGRYLQFIPCIGPDREGEKPPKWALTPEDYAYFLKALFDLWYQDWKNGSYVSIRQFDDYVNLLCGRHPSSCAAAGICGSHLVVENDGSLYPCDFFVDDNWCLGTVTERSLTEILTAGKAKQFVNERYLPESCKSCRYYGLCRGGCKNDYQWSGDLYSNRFCGAFQEFFAYGILRLQEIAAIEKRFT